MEFIKRSKGAYHWASAAHHFLLSCPHGDECTILENILSIEYPHTKEDAIDQLFRSILIHNPHIPSMYRSLIRSSKPVPLQDSPHRISKTASESTHQSPFLYMMQTLHLLIENGKDETDNPLFSIHPSLEDFLTNPRRCHGTDFYVDRLAPAPSLARTMLEVCFNSMEKWLKHNICNLGSTMVLNEEIPNKDDRIHRCIPGILQHACRNWMYHLEALDDDKLNSMDPALKQLDAFLSNRLLHWIECMSLLGWVDVIPDYLHRLSAWLIVGSLLNPLNYHLTYISIMAF